MKLDLELIVIIWIAILALLWSASMMLK